MNKKTSPHASFYREARKIAKQLYENGVTDPAALARHCQVKVNTVKRWIKVGEWIPKEEQAKDLQEKIEQEADQALLFALRKFRKEPGNKDLQSLNSMLKSYLERRKPDKKLLEYILRFQEDVIEYCMETGNETLRKHYQAVLVELSEWLRKKYVRV